MWFVKIITNPAGSIWNWSTHLYKVVSICLCMSLFSLFFFSWFHNYFFFIYRTASTVPNIRSGLILDNTDCLPQCELKNEFGKEKWMKKLKKKYQRIDLILCDRHCYFKWYLNIISSLIYGFWSTVFEMCSPHCWELGTEQQEASFQSMSRRLVKNVRKKTNKAMKNCNGLLQIFFLISFNHFNQCPAFEFDFVFITIPVVHNSEQSVFKVSNVCSNILWTERK